MNRVAIVAGISLASLALAFRASALAADPSPTNVLKQATEYLQADKCDEAIELLDALIRKSPTLGRAYARPHRTYAKLGEFPKALPDFDKAIKLNPRDAQSYTNRGAVRLRMQDEKSAMADYNKAVAVDPKFAMAYQNRAMLFKRNKQYKEAAADWDKVAALNPKDVVPIIERGDVYNQAGNFQAADADATNSIEMAPQLPNGYSIRAAAKFGLKDLDGAREAYDQAIQLAPNRATLYLDRSRVPLALGDRNAALADLNKATRASSVPGKAAGHQLYGGADLERDLGKKVDAFNDYCKAIDEDPKNVHARVNRGKINADFRQKKESLADFDEAVNNAPNDAVVLITRAYFRLWFGDDAAAQADFDGVVKLDPSLKSEVESEIEFCKQHRPPPKTTRAETASASRPIAGKVSGRNATERPLGEPSQANG